ncbi:MAG: radical SAM protein [Nitrospirota bacterium]|nr:radical SAM protein [Nitrospirota bacterium]
MASFSVVVFEDTNICNANCVFCGYQYQERPQGIQSFEEFRVAADLFRARGRAVIANFTPAVGDPLVDHEITRKIRYCKEVGFERVWLTTNLIGLKSVGELLESGVDLITISMPEPQRESYLEIYRSPKFDLFFRNLDQLLSENQRRGFPVRVGLALRCPYGALRVLLRNAALRRLVGQLKFGLWDISVETRFDDWGGRITTENLPPGMSIRPNPEKAVPCFMLRFPGVTWDNKLVVCPCRDLNADSTLVVGRVEGTDPAQLVALEERASQITDRWKSGELPDICQNCRQYRPATTSRQGGRTSHPGR